MAPWDFFIGSVHYFRRLGDRRSAVLKSTWKRRGIWTDYWRNYRAPFAASCSIFVAHPDLPKKFVSPQGSSPLLRARGAALAESGVACEINTAGRKECRELYPAPVLWRWPMRPGTVLINSDAHAVAELGLRLC